MTPERWIEVTRWDEFQHYQNREPIFIKNYTRLLSDPNYGYLTHAQRSTLHGLWLLYARSHRQIPDSTAWITRQLGVRVTRATLEALNHAGFIRFVASKPLALARSQDLELEKDKSQSLQEPRGDAVENFDSLETLEAIFGRQAGSYPQAEDQPLKEDEPWS